MIKLESSVQCELLRLLSIMFVIRAYIYMQVAENFSSECILWQHAADRVLDQGKRLSLQLLNGRALSLTPWITRVTDVFLLLPLLSCQNNLLCIDRNRLATSDANRPKVWPSASTTNHFLSAFSLLMERVL
jgi:hypothetical protein